MFDVIVIGSGFGGAVTAARLAEQNYKVLVLERGRRWDKASYPRKPGDMWTWNPAKPESENGWLDLRTFDHIAVAQGAAVGGGSLIYANISCEAPPDTFANGWPAEITYGELKPHYDTVASFMNVQQVPDNQWTERMRLMKQGATAIGEGGRFRKLDLAVTFDPAFDPTQADPTNPANSKRFTNAQGVEQGTCVHLGNCDIGCDVDARNTLDRNYIPWAEKYSADVRELHLVTDIEPITGGYKVSFDQLQSGARVAGSETARIVIVAAGSLFGSTELLLRCRDVTQSLPGLSQRLGYGWSSNGDFLTPALYPGRAVRPSFGPTITCAIDFLDGSQGTPFWIQDGGLPNVLSDMIQAEGTGANRGFMAQELLTAIQHMLRGAEPGQDVMPWFAQGRDAADGQLKLARRMVSNDLYLDLQWDVAKSKVLMDQIVAMHLKLSAATGGFPLVPPTWSLFQYLITPHPLGGCGMGGAATEGVVNHAGEAFGYRNLYIADAAIIPEALGVNPSRTIAALAERIAKLIAAEGR